MAHPPHLLTHHTRLQYTTYLSCEHHRNYLCFEVWVVCAQLITPKIIQCEYLASEHLQRVFLPHALYNMSGTGGGTLFGMVGPTFDYFEDINKNVGYCIGVPVNNAIH